MRPQFTARHDIVGVGLVETHGRMRILGLSAYYHDSAAAIVMDGNIVAAAQKERISRQKHDSRFPTQAIAYCSRGGAVTLD